MADYTPVTPEKKAAFLAALAERPNITKASVVARFSRLTAYRLRDSDPAFAAEWDAALKLGVAKAEEEAWRRATDGTLEPVFYQGERCGSIRRYSDTLLIFMLKAHRPDVYRELIDHRVTGKDGEPIAVAVTLTWGSAPDEPPEEGDLGDGDEAGSEA